MNLYAPAYYKDFKCIADKCKHNCCIGWEIDIDKTSHNYYKAVGGEFGKRLKSEISSDDIPHFTLTNDERCPFLNDKNLCDIILKLGEDRLCQICTDHPRFRNFYDSRTEIGLGLCCEAAGKLILSQTNKMTINSMDSDSDATDEEAVFFNLRERLFCIIQDRSLPITERIDNILDFCKIEFDINNIPKWAEAYLKLERLNPKWTDMLVNLKNTSSSSVSTDWDTVFEQLAAYFLYRHLPDGLSDGMLLERIVFCVLSFYMIYSLCGMRKNLNFEDIVEISRMYSSEIEYCEENVQSLLDMLRIY